MQSRRSLALLALVLAPVARAADTGAITGTVDKPADVTAVTAVDRATDKKFPGKVDARTGRFVIEGLPLGATYDVSLDAGAARREGVNLKVPRSDYEEEQPLSKEDVETITKIARALNQFENEVDVLAVSGNIQHAAVVLNKRRTKPFYDSKPGQIVWRLELWHFDKPEEQWVKSQDELGLVLYRERIQKSEYDKKALTLDPALGGVALTDKNPRADLGAVAPPREPGIRLRPEPPGGK
jgi:hypothetical protein